MKIGAGGVAEPPCIMDSSPLASVGEKGGGGVKTIFLLSPARKRGGQFMGWPILGLEGGVAKG